VERERKVGKIESLDLSKGGKKFSQIQFIIIQIYITFNPFKWIYLKNKSIFLNFKSDSFNCIWIRYRLDTFLDYAK